MPKSSNAAPRKRRGSPAAPRKRRSTTNFNDVLKIAALLRSKKGCPWDKQQTIKSMMEHFAEEAQEVKDAIEKGDHENLKEELGDLLFNIVMISQIAKEQKLFNIDNVMADIVKKIKTRHTWVFGKDKAKTPEEALKLWLKNKETEKLTKKTNKTP